MKNMISCEFNIDTACVELKFLDGSMIAIDTIAVENEVADNMYQRSEPVSYTHLNCHWTYIKSGKFIFRKSGIVFFQLL